MKDEPVAVGPDFQLRAQVSAIIKMNMEIVEMNAWIIREIMAPRLIVDSKLPSDTEMKELLRQPPTAAK